MARKPPYKYVSREESPAFQALVSQLEGVDPAEFPARARALVERHHDAVLAGDVAELDATHDGYEALVYVLNGNTLFGSMADENSAGHVLARAVAATPGQVPRWGQMGEFLLEVDGMRIRVKVREGLGNHHSIDLNAVDLDKPFLSETGYRHHGVTATSHLGETFDQAVRRAVIELIEGEGKPKAIKADAFVFTSPEPHPKWLAGALAGILPDGQLAMFGDAPESDKPKAKSNAERQREFRRRQTEQKKQAAQQGLRTVQLPDDAVAYLWCAMDVYWTVRKDLDHQGTACVREWLEPIFRGAPWFKGAQSFDQLGEDPAVLVTEKHRESERKRGWKAYHDECQRNAGMVDRLNAMQRELTALKRENALLESERNKAHGAIALWEQRLRTAGLSTDYRPQPGELGVTGNEDI
jgi:hypothetical protein